MAVLFWIIFIIALLIIGPLLTIWSLNTLFPMLNIAYGFNEWAAVILLGAALRANVEGKK
jgi:hypothetical protein